MHLSATKQGLRNLFCSFDTTIVQSIPLPRPKCLNEHYYQAHTNAYVHTQVWFPGYSTAKIYVLIKETRFQNNVVKGKLELCGRHFAKSIKWHLLNFASYFCCTLPFITHLKDASNLNTCKRRRQNNSNERYFIFTLLE